MDKTLFESLKQSLKEARDIRHGGLAPGRVTEISPPDAKSVRAKARATTAKREKARLVKCFMGTSLLNKRKLSHLQVTGR